MNCGVRTAETSPKDELAAPEYCVYCGKQIDPRAYLCVYCGKLTREAVKNSDYKKSTSVIGIVFACISIVMSMIYISLNLILGAIFAVLGMSFSIANSNKKGKIWGLIAIIVCVVRAFMAFGLFGYMFI